MPSHRHLLLSRVIFDLHDGSFGQLSAARRLRLGMLLNTIIPVFGSKELPSLDFQ